MTRSPVVWSSNCTMISCPKKSLGTDWASKEGRHRHTRPLTMCYALPSTHSQLRSSDQGRRSCLGVQLLRCQIKHKKQKQAAAMHSLVTRCIQIEAWKGELGIRMAWEKDCLLQQFQQNWGVQLTQNIIFWAPRDFGSSPNKRNIPLHPTRPTISGELQQTHFEKPVG